MPHAHLAATDTPNHEVLHRVQKYILVTAVLLALAALVEHHPGLMAVVAVVAVLALALIERLISLPADSAPANTKYRSADGGSFRAGEVEKKTRASQGVIVIDGGSKK